MPRSPVELTRTLPFLFLALTGLAPAHVAVASDPPPRLLLTAPGEVLSLAQYSRSPHHAPTDQPKQPWNVVSLSGTEIKVEEVSNVRDSDWRLRTNANSVKRTPGTVPILRNRPVKHALDMPAGSLLAFRFMSEKNDKLSAYSVAPGAYASLLSSAAVLHDRWEASVRFRGEDWTFGTESTRRKDGALLAGSMALVARNAAGEKRVLLAPAHDMAFERQELLWIGALRTDWNPTGFDFLIKRTWITGEIEYVLAAGGLRESILIDLDRPHLHFSQGVEEYEGTESHVAQRRPVPTGRFGAAAFAIDEVQWNSSFNAAAATELPKQLFDRQLPLAGEKIRFTAEYLPRLPMPESGLSSSYFLRFWNGPALLKANFRGKTQVLMEIGVQDGGRIRVQVDLLNGEPAIQVEHSPHYNNGFTDTWVWDAQQGRFLRLHRLHSQGC